MAGQVAGGLLSLLPQIIASPGLGVASTQLGTAEDLTNQGVNAGRANVVGGIQGAGLGLGVWLPILGANLWQRVLLGGVGLNTTLGITTRGASGALLKGTPGAEDYKAFDPAAITLDVLLGAAFGSMAHLSPEARAHGAATVEKLRDWARNFKPSDVDALATLRQAQHLNVDSVPGKPEAPADVEAHVAKVKTAIEQLERNQPVETSDMPAGKFEPDPARTAEAARRVDEMVKSADEIRAAEGLHEPEVPHYLRMNDEMRATYDDLQRLPREEQATGVGDVIEAQLRKAGVPEAEAQANASIWKAFAQTTADRYGINPADVLTRYGLTIKRNAPAIEGALEQKVREVLNTPEFRQWFGASKVVNQKGEPLVVYHGTGADFTSFDDSRIERPGYGRGFHFADNPRVANFYAQQWRSGDRLTGDTVMPTYLKIEHPFTGDYYKYMQDKGLDHGPLPVGMTRHDLVKQSLIKEGYDGIRYKHPSMDHTFDGYAWVAFHPEQIKSAIGNRGTFDPNDPNILHQAGAEPFYSELARQVDNVNMKSGTAQSWKDWIKGLGSKGVKAEEVKWSGLEEWLDLQEGRIRKEQVQEFLRNNGVRVEEVMLGSGGQRTPRDPEIAGTVENLDANGFRVDQAPDMEDEYLPRWGFEDVQTGDILANEHDVRGYLENGDIEGPVAEAMIRALRYLNGGELEGKPTKFSGYQLPGGENYRELLLTLPGEKPTDRNTMLPPGYRVELMQHKLGWTLVTPDGSGQVMTNLNFDAPRWAATEEAIRLLRRQGVITRPGEARFQSSHFDEPNILAHIRFNDRTDAEGKRVLFLEEIQSDWAQQGKKKGFARQRAETIGQAGIRIEHRTDGERFPWAAFDPNGALLYAGLLEDQVRQRALSEWNDGFAKGVPAAPFVGKTDAWVALALKRMIRYAAEKGYDRIAWTTGEQQVDRYSSALRKAVDVIEWKKTPEGVHIVGYKGGAANDRSGLERDARHAALNNMRELGNLGFDTPFDALGAIYQHRADWRQRWDVAADHGGAVERWLEIHRIMDAERGGRGTKVVDTVQKEDELSDAIGKAMAERIRNDLNQSGTIEGENINVSDTGMAGFYNRIVPSVAKAVLKKLGGEKVGTVEFPGAKAVWPREYDGAGGMVQPTVPAGWEVADTDVGLRPRSQPGFDITPQMREAALAGQPLFQYSRGQIQFGDEKTIINLFENANASTFLHETGHFFLQLTRDMSTAPNAPMEAMRDWATLQKELGFEGHEIPREAHEQFARSFEAYLREGKAPTPELRSAFQQFRDWLIGIYESIADLKVELTAQMRAVMDRMLASQGQDPAPGTPSSAPPGEASGIGNPPPPGGGSEPPAVAGPKEPFEPRTIEHPDMRTALETMAAHEAGWYQVGGKHLGGEQGTPNFSSWIPNSDWWVGRPDKLNEAKTREAVRKALAGEPLKKAEQRMVDYLVGVANKRMEKSQIEPKERAMLPEDLINEGEPPTHQNIEDADLVARAAEIDPDAIEAAAIRYENHDAAFLAEARRIVNGHEAQQARSGSQEDQRPPQNEPEVGTQDPQARLLSDEADRIVAERPDQLITVGANPDGSPIHMTAREYLDQERAVAAQAREDIKLLEVAAGCLMGRT